MVARDLAEHLQTVRSAWAVDSVNVISGRHLLIGLAVTDEALGRWFAHTGLAAALLTTWPHDRRSRRR